MWSKVTVNLLVVFLFININYFCCSLWCFGENGKMSTNTMILPILVPNLKGASQNTSTILKIHHTTIHQVFADVVIIHAGFTAKILLLIINGKELVVSTGKDTNITVCFTLTNTLQSFVTSGVVTNDVMFKFALVAAFDVVCVGGVLGFHDVTIGVLKMLLLFVESVATVLSPYSVTWRSIKIGFAIWGDWIKIGCD